MTNAMSDIQYVILTATESTSQKLIVSRPISFHPMKYTWTLNASGNSSKSALAGNRGVSF